MIAAYWYCKGRSPPPVQELDDDEDFHEAQRPCHRKRLRHLCRCKCCTDRKWQHPQENGPAGQTYSTFWNNVVFYYAQANWPWALWRFGGICFIVWDRIVADILFVAVTQFWHTWVLVLYWVVYIVPFITLTYMICANRVYGRARKCVNCLSTMLKVKHMYIMDFDMGMDGAMPDLPYILMSYIFLLPIQVGNLLVVGEQLSYMQLAVPLSKYAGATYSIYHLVYIGLKWGKPEGRTTSCLISLLGLLQMALISVVGIMVNWRNGDIT